MSACLRQGWWLGFLFLLGCSKADPGPLDLNTIKNKRTYTGMEKVHWAGFTPDRRWLCAVGTDDGAYRVCVWDVGSGTLLKSHSAKELSTVRILGMGNRELLVKFWENDDEDTTVGRFDFASGRGTGAIVLAGSSMPHRGDLFAAPEGKYYLAVQVGKAQLWDAQGNLLRRFEDLDFGGGTHSAVFDLEHDLVVVGCPNALSVLPLGPEGKPVVLALEAGESVYGLAIHDGRRIATGAFDEPTRLYDWDGQKLQRGRVLGEARQEGHAVSFSRTGKYLLSVGPQRLRFWDTETGNLVHHYRYVPGGVLNYQTFVAGTDLVLSCPEPGNALVLEPLAEMPLKTKAP
ncbi:MAG: WD40 repeat domain-containing protein [Gemmataceae bacterium]